VAALRKIPRGESAEARHTKVPLLYGLAGGSKTLHRPVPDEAALALQTSLELDRTVLEFVKVHGGHFDLTL